MDTIIAALALALTPAGADAGFDFDGRVAPILARRCLGCHSGADPKGGLDLSSRESALRGGDGGEAITPGEPAESPLWERVDEGSMPPKKPLPGEEAEALRAWIEAGAPWGSGPIDPFRFSTASRAGRDWWSFRPAARPEVPGAGGENPIDAFVRDRLAREGLRPAPEADRRTLIRRLAFGLTGLPPSPEEVDAFLADDRPDAYERLVDAYLASPQYGVRWARLWLDLARYGESNGFEHDEFRPDAWRYRDWVVDALNRDLPYDEFARLQLAGDVLRPDDPGAVEATGFLVAGAYDTVGQGQQSEAMRRVVRQDELEDYVGTVGQAFLGLTVHCARCHDHKFDPIPQVDYYRLASALSGVRHGERDLSALDPAIRAARGAIADRLARVAAIEAPARDRLLGSVPGAAPTPVASWDFTLGGLDAVGGLHATPRGAASFGPDGLTLDGKTGHAVAAPLSADLTGKTLEAWVRLDGLAQRGGGVIGVQMPDGGRFDAIVFGEREPGRWMAGSEGFARTRSFEGPEERSAADAPVHVAITYAEDGTIAAYRDGRPYGTPYRAGPPARFPAGRAQVVFGLRHGTPGGDRMLAGTIRAARLYDRALTPDEVAASAAAGAAIAEADLAGALAPGDRDERSRLIREIADLAKAASAARRAYAVAPRPPEPTHRLRRGEASRPAEVVAPGGLEALAGLSPDFGLGPDADEGARRVRLAAWISDPAHPLFARVAVNRLWQAHFGVGLVETPSDFGFQGGTPSHPELLDWLASELVAGGWRLKAIHRRIVTSAAYRQSSRFDPDAARVDAAGRLLWRKAPARLEAEMVRDAMLAVSGALDPGLGGPGFREFEMARNSVGGTTRYLPAEAVGPGSDRRTLFRAWPRGGRSGFLDAFDCPDPSTATPRRTSTTTPIQALTLLNDATTFRLADRFADRLRREAGDDPGRQVERAYRLAFGRAPTPDEAEPARRVVERFGTATLARAIFNSSEFLDLD